MLRQNIMIPVKKVKRIMMDVQPWMVT
ncbi:hypothetical protein LCGC14_1718470, partial [marine sediment metagenome]